MRIGVMPEQALKLGYDLVDVWNEGKSNHEQFSSMDNSAADKRFLALGLCGEAGELANFIKKEWRDKVDHDEDIRAEIADVCLYAFMLADNMGMTPRHLVDMMVFKQNAFREKMVAMEAARA